MDITGAPTLFKRFDDGNDDVSFDDLCRYDRNQYLICCSTPGQDTYTEGGSKAGKTSGLVPGHAYTVIAAMTLTDGPYAGTQLLKIRNPWGNFEWGGAFSDNSAEMAEPSVRAALYDDASTEEVWRKPEPWPCA